MLAPKSLISTSLSLSRLREENSLLLLSKAAPSLPLWTIKASQNHAIGDQARILEAS
jgi:hypothetical protein